MRRAAGRLARVGAIGLTAAIGLPVALLVPASVLDRGPSGESRASFFPIALTLLDPLVWSCARNSLIVAAIVTLGSLGLGVALARAVGPWRFWGRRPLAALAWAPMAVAPAFAAVGLARVFPPGAIGRRLAAATGNALLFEVPWDVWISWGLLVWAGVAAATPVVALSVGSALGRVDPSWVDAGRALGASRRRAWRALVWPILRPEVARTLAAVFAAALLDPGAPIVLGLRRTLVVPMVEAATGGGLPARAAALALLGLGLALLGRVLIRAWGGSRVDVDPHDRDDPPPRAGGARVVASAVGLSAWIAVGLTPLAGLVGIVVGAFDAGGGGGEGEGWVVAAASVVYRLIDPDTALLWRNALGLGLAATLVAALLVRALARPADPSRRLGPRASVAILAFERTPPLVLGIALALCPGLLETAADRLGIPVLHRLAAWLDPIRWPGVLLIVATAASRLPTLARAADRADVRSRPVLADAARGLGATRRQARRVGGGRGVGRGVLALTFALAATSVAPALVLSPTSRTRTVGPGLVLAAADPPRAAALALGAVALNLIGLAAARRGPSGPAGDWFRG